MCDCSKLPQLQTLILHLCESENELMSISKKNGEIGGRQESDSTLHYITLHYNLCSVRAIHGI